MSRIIGRNTKIGLFKEAVRGTTGAPSFWIPVLDLGYDDKLELKENESGFGNIAAVSDSQIIRKWAEGTYGGKIFDRSVGLELTALFGQSPTSVQRASSGVYDHTYAMLNTNQHQSVTVAVTEPNYSGRYALGAFNSWSLQAEVGDYIRRTVNLMSKASASSSETVGYTNETEFLPKHMAIKFAAAGASSATLDAATAAKIRAFNFEISKNAEAIQLFGTTDIDDVINKQVTITGSFEVYYDDRSYHTLANNGTHQAIRIEMLNTDVTIGAIHNPALRFEFPEVALQFPDKSFGNNDIAILTVNFTAVLNIASGSLVTARLTNLYAGTLY